MRIRLLAVGRLSRHYKPVFAHYAGLLAPYTRLEVVEISETALSRGVEIVQREEAEALRRRSSAGWFTVALDRRGDQPDSEALSALLAERKLRGQSDFQFILGGAVGLDEALVREADWVWSLSNLTFPHELARVLVAEQLYRAFKIERGEPYHH